MKNSNLHFLFISIFFMLIFSSCKSCNKKCPECEPNKPTNAFLYSERSNGQILSKESIRDESILPYDSDQIAITVPEDGDYIVLAKGTFDNRGYCISDPYLCVYNETQKNSIIDDVIIKTQYNHVGHPENCDCNSIRILRYGPGSQEITGTINKKTTKPLKKGDVIKLRYGHKNITSCNDLAFWFAFPGDYLGLIRVP